MSFSPQSMSDLYSFLPDSVNSNNSETKDFQDKGLDMNMSMEAFQQQQMVMLLQRQVHELTQSLVQVQQERKEALEERDQWRERAAALQTQVSRMQENQQKFQNCMNSIQMAISSTEGHRAPNRATMSSFAASGEQTFEVHETQEATTVRGTSSWNAQLYTHCDTAASVTCLKDMLQVPPMLDQDEERPITRRFGETLRRTSLGEMRKFGSDPKVMTARDSFCDSSVSQPRVQRRATMDTSSACLKRTAPPRIYFGEDEKPITRRFGQDETPTTRHYGEDEKPIARRFGQDESKDEAKPVTRRFGQAAHKTEMTHEKIEQYTQDYDTPPVTRRFGEGSMLPPRGSFTSSKPTPNQLARQSSFSSIPSIVSPSNSYNSISSGKSENALMARTTGRRMSMNMVSTRNDVPHNPPAFAVATGEMLCPYFEPPQSTNIVIPQPHPRRASAA